MLIVLHVTIALLSLLQATLTLVRPTRAKLHRSYGLIAATLASGILLVWQLHSPLVSSCFSGLFYLATAASLLALANRRLAKAPVAGSSL
jgi:hypothetical protein